MGLGRFVSSVLASEQELSEPHINEVWLLPGNFNDKYQDSFMYPTNPVRVYRVENVPPGEQWTADRHAYPHIDHRHEKGHLTECVPTAAYSGAQLGWYGDKMTPEALADDWNASDAASQGEWRGSTYHYSAAEVEEEMNRLY